LAGISATSSSERSSISSSSASSAVSPSISSAVRARSSSSDHFATTPRAPDRTSDVERGGFRAETRARPDEPARRVDVFFLAFLVAPARARGAAFVLRDRFGAAFRAVARFRAPPRLPAAERRFAGPRFIDDPRLPARPRALPPLFLPTADREVFREPPRPPFFAFFATSTSSPTGVRRASDHTIPSLSRRVEARGRPR